MQSRLNNALRKQYIEKNKTLQKQNKLNSKSSVQNKHTTVGSHLHLFLMPPYIIKERSQSVDRHFSTMDSVQR